MLGVYNGPAPPDKAHRERQRSGRVAFDSSPNPATSHLIIGPSEKRCALVFFGPTNGHVTLSNDTPVVAENGIVLSATAGALELTREEHGALMDRPWYCIGSGGTSIVSWIEVVYLD